MRHLLPIMTALLLLLVSGASSSQSKGSKGSGVSEKHMVYVEGVPAKDEITLEPGQVLQLQPFTYPAVADFLNAGLRMKVSDDKVLGVIGELETPSSREGRSGMSAFFLAREPGTCTLKVTLVNGEKKPIPDYEASYRVTVKEKR